MDDNETPKIIYLQPGMGEEGETTWCEDQINEDDIAYFRADVVEHLENLLNGILQPGEWWLELRRGYKGAGENAVEWLSEHGDSYGLAEQRVIEGIRDAIKAMVK